MPVGHREVSVSVAVLVAAWTIAHASSAVAQDGQISFRTGVEFVSGDYGGTQDVGDLYLPFTVLYEGRRTAFRVTLPYIEAEFADSAGSTYTESGIGDVALGLTVYDVFRSSNGSVAIDVTGKLKLGTADEQKGLGTGERDFSVQADIYKFLGRATFVASAGYSARGEPANVTIENAWLASAGGFYRFSSSTSGGLFVDYRQSSIPGATSIKEVTASLSRTLSGRWRLQGYLVHGLSDTSLDWGAGLASRFDF